MSRNTNQSPATQDEALAVAKSIQKPGQTKEQTKLIAQGIAKGIETYKSQQSAKARERDKTRKRLLREARKVQSTQEIGDPLACPGANLQELALRISGGLLMGIALAAWLPLLFGWPVMVGGWVLAPALLPTAGTAAAVVSIACFYLSATS